MENNPPTDKNLSEPIIKAKGFHSWFLARLIPFLFLVMAVWVGVRFLLPTVDYHEPTEIRTAPVSSFAPGVDSRWSRDYEFFLVREGKGLFAVSARDKYTEKTFHQKALIHWRPETQQFVETGSGSLYDERGNAAGGPTRWPLDRLALRINDAGEVVVDPKNVQNMDGDVKKTGNIFGVEETIRETEPFVLRLP